MISLLDLFDQYRLPMDVWIRDGVNWLVMNARPFFLAAREPVAIMLNWFDEGLNAIPPLIFLAGAGALAWFSNGWKLAAGTVGGFLVIGFLGLWGMTMTTLAMTLTAVTFCILVGVPIGTFAAQSNRFERSLMPVLDAMQTTPTFVYLVPIVMLFGIGNVPSVLATIIVALPPMIRLTSLGIREVDPEIIEAGRAFGCTRFQILREIQIPLAMPTIMTGLNQALMLSLSMVVVAALIGAGGLGLSVYSGINRLDVGLAGIAGLAIVALAIILDRIVRGFASGGKQ